MGRGSEALIKIVFSCTVTDYRAFLHPVLFCFCILANSASAATLKGSISPVKRLMKFQKAEYRVGLSLIVGIMGAITD